jgi:hypothetical protein
MTRSISFSRPMTGSQLALAGRLGEVATELVENQLRRRGALAPAAGGALGGLLALITRVGFQKSA